MATMNDCKQIQPLLAEYADGELIGETTRQVETHVQSCAVCQSIADDFAATARLVSSLPTPKGPSANFEAMLARRIADECLAPKPLSPLDKLRVWWDEKTAPSAAGYRFAPALAGAFVVLVALFPAGYLLTRSDNVTVTRVLPLSSPDTAANLVASDPTLTELWDEHTSFSSAQLLGDPATALTGIAEN
ncbi:MAG: zf-HC2 domain-containing protein [Akkermansiaceae bacterium]|nr:zf-HC2 domain-containing protein [Armatimonadota bacterium]